MVEWKKDDSVAILTMNNGENRQNPVFTEAIMKVFDEIVADEEIKALVITSNDPKNWSLGVDLAWMMEKQKDGDQQAISDWIINHNEFFKFLLMAPFPTIAAITGHAFGNGAMMAGACDFRFMRSDRGYMCLPEVDYNIQFTPSMIEWMKKAIPYNLFIDMKLTGRKVGAAELAEHNVIKKACKDIDETLSEAIAYAKTFQKSRKTMAEMKKRTYKHIVDKMENDDLEYIKVPIFMLTP